MSSSLGGGSSWSAFGLLLVFGGSIFAIGVAGAVTGLVLVAAFAALLAYLILTKKGSGILRASLVLAIVGVLLGFAAEVGEKRSGDKVFQEETSRDATEPRRSIPARPVLGPFETCADVVREELAKPETARIERPHDETRDVTNAHYFWFFVASENSSGTREWTEYYCTVRRSAGRWRVSALRATECGDAIDCAQPPEEP